MAAYGFSRFTSKGVSVAFAFVLATMLIPEVVTARPLYEFMQKVKLYDTYPGLILLYISTVIPFTVLILRNFVGEIPISLEEAAAIDGASFSQRLFTIVLPLMKPAIATVCIINFITCLNNFSHRCFIQMVFRYFLFPSYSFRYVTTCMEFRGIWSVPWDGSSFFRSLSL